MKVETPEDREALPEDEGIEKKGWKTEPFIRYIKRGGWSGELSSIKGNLSDTISKQREERG